MIKKRTLFIPIFVVSAALAGCGGGGGVAEQSGDAVEAVGDAAGELATDAAGAVADTATDAAGAVADTAAAAKDVVADTASAAKDALDPAAWTDIEMNWDSQISSVQEAFPDLSVDEITGTAGKPDNLVSLVQEKYGISLEQAQAKVSEWVSKL